MFVLVIYEYEGCVIIRLLGREYAAAVSEVDQSLEILKFLVSPQVLTYSNTGRKSVPPRPRICMV